MKDTFTTNQQDIRIDLLLSQKYPDYSRSYFANLIKTGHVHVNKKLIKPSYLIQPDDEITIEFLEKKGIFSLLPEKISLDIVYEDIDVIVVNKQPGLVVHPAAGNEEGTLVNALINYFPKIREAVYQKGNPVSESRPGLVHRLDKDTSGLIIVAKNARAMHSLSRQIQNRTITKIYLALCAGWPRKETGTIVSYLGRDPKDRRKIAEVGMEKGREAISDFKVLKCMTNHQGDKVSLLEFNIHTGRTHQIRVHAKSLGHPVLGDPFYFNAESSRLTKKYSIKRQLLHAFQLTVTLPGEERPSTFEAPLPDDFDELLDKFVE